MRSVVTVARQLGAGGAELATRLAERLGWRLLDRALVERIAAEMRVDPDQVERCDERVESFAERLGMYLSEGYPEVLPLPVLPPLSPELTARTARRLVSVVVEEGPAVIVGHGSQCVLQDDPRALHLLVHAPRVLRVQRASARFQLTPGEAEDRIRISDRDRRSYVREHFDQEWLDPTLYHLCLDTGRLGMDAAVELAAAACAAALPSPPWRHDDA